MIVKFEGKSYSIEFNYSGSTKTEDEIMTNINEIKKMTLKKMTGKEDVEKLMTKFKIRRSDGLQGLLPTDFHDRPDPEKNSILREVFKILNDPEIILSLIYQPLSPAHFAQGAIPGVGVASKKSKKSRDKKRSRKNKTKKNKKKRSKRRSRKLNN